jgi:hypothetical protein
MFILTKIKYYGAGSVVSVMAHWVFAILGFLFYILGTSFSLAANPYLYRICVSPDGVNTLQWVVNKDTCDDLVSIEIYGRESGSASSFKKIGAISDGTIGEYTHTGAATFQKGAYFLHYTIKCDGNFVSVYSDTVDADYQAPEIIDPDSVSIVNGKVVIGWTPSKAPDTKSYVIYWMVGSANKIIDTVYGRFNTFYKDKLSGDPTVKSERYKIAARDSCDNIAPIGDFHETIFLRVSSDTCKGEIYLSWSPYVGWTTGVEKYDVFIKDSAGYRKISTTVNLGDTLKGLKTNVVYSIFIRAYKKGGGATSSSNVIVHKADFGDVMEYLYISAVTYEGSRLQVKWIGAPYPALDHFELWRGRDKVHMERIRVLAKTEFLWQDNNPGETIWYFKLRAYSTCGKLLTESNTSNSIVLSIRQEAGHRVLYWNSYASWLNGVARYDVYQQVYGADTTNLLPIGTTDKSTTFFVDTASILLDTLPGACYYVEATESGFNKLGVRGISKSSTVCYVNAPIVYIPNAFAPHEFTNTRFKPSLLNANIENSGMQIYNRWGQRVVDEVDLTMGWDGILNNGHVAPEGVYFYVLNVRGIDGSRKVYKGTVTLL